MNILASEDWGTHLRDLRAVHEADMAHSTGWYDVHAAALSPTSSMGG
jgi:hypothetical protein